MGRGYCNTCIMSMANFLGFWKHVRMNTMTDVVIVGGGVIGCAIAYFLRKQHVDVTLLERGKLGGEASGVAAGLLAPLGPLSGPGPFADLVLAGFSSLVALVSELEEESGMKMGYERTGALRVVCNQKRVAHLRKRMQSWQGLGLQLYWLDGDEARQREPLLASDVCAAIYVPEESQIRAASVVQGFARGAQRMGAHIHEQQEVNQLLTNGARVTGVCTGQGETIFCNSVILASGAWVAQCAAWLNVTLPIHPLHGQLLSLLQPSPPLQHIVFGNAGYLVPRGDMLLVGATKDERGFDATVTEQGTSWLYETATQLVPALRSSEIQATWAGLRPHTPDSRPIVSFLPAWENIILAAGHNSVGVILSALTGQGVAEMITTGEVPLLWRPFSAERFLVE